MRAMWTTLVILALSTLAMTQACADDGAEADRLGVGATCAADEACAEGQRCLTQFKGGYCGLSGCAADADCPQGAACVEHDDGQRYCFRVCTTKADCNAHRDAALEANCSSSVTFVETTDAGKACVPPSGG